VYERDCSGRPIREVVVALHPTQPKPAPCGVTVAASSIEFTQNSSDTVRP